ncbi:MAG: glycoside hydrolase family 5 protein [Fibrobacter sp.]|nr:glycoside hydrolase family 5 protein [Fibrobacter sp.]
MKPVHLIPLVLSLCLWACGGDNKPTATDGGEDSVESSNSNAKAVDYSLGRAMNNRLGKGINLGNAWDGAAYWTCGTLKDAFDQGDSAYIPLVAADTSDYVNMPFKRYNYGCRDRLDSSWSNPISDDYFKFLKDAGFNSIRLPVRWQHNSNPETHEVNPDRLAGVKQDVKLAIDAGLAVVVSFHWYHELMFAGNHVTTLPDYYAEEKAHFAALWKQIASEFKDFPDTMLVWDILNEPTFKDVNILNEIMNTGYEAIRSVDKNKTIMFESYHAGKFADIVALQLPEDGNIIFSGHYYEPYNYSHQGHSYACKGDDAYAMTAYNDFKAYADSAKKMYPDKNGGFIPMNMGEFGVSGGKSNPCGSKGPSDKYRAIWTRDLIKAVAKYDISWHYWGFVGVGGFEAYDKSSGNWYPGMLEAFGLTGE